MITGALTFETVVAISKASRPLFVPESTLHVSLAGVIHTDSAAVALVLEWMRQAHHVNASLQLEHIPSQMLSIAKMCGLQTLIEGKSATLR